MKPDNGGPAFPCTEANYSDPKWTAEGMSLRDYFAAKIVVAYLQDEHYLRASMGAFANTAYAMADAMLEARKK